MRELLINNQNDKNLIFLIEDKKIVEYYEDSEEHKNLDGNIYIGKVQNIVPGLEAAFINLGEDKNAFIHKKDILPKQDETKEKFQNSTPITKLIKPGDPLLVEVKKDKMQTKGARVSTHIGLRGRMIVLMPNSPYVTLSSKIQDEEKRKSLKEMVSAILPEGMGAIIRTTAEKASKEEIIEDVIYQIEKWKKIQNTEFENYPVKIYDSGGILKKTIIDLIDFDLDRIVVNTKENLEKVQAIIEEIGGKTKINLEERDLSKLYDIEKQISKINSNKIWLKSGGFITIDRTEALTAIDVNTGKFIGDTNLEETIYKVNEEAAKEIAKQLRLRDIGGIIVIDFIDMHKKENIEKIIKALQEFCLEDRSRVQIEEFTKLNLLELTRKQISRK
ncbi:MAG: Rne/Rng family ribonuclease [Clostridia bacterium]|nr:Rne/Rng family ribonuclease [Clostridia bacterium]